MAVREWAFAYKSPVWLVASTVFWGGLLPWPGDLRLAAGAEPVEIQVYNFSNASEFVIPADGFSAQVKTSSTEILGPDRAISLTRLQPTPSIPERFEGNVLKAVGAGGVLAGGDGFDAAHVPGARLNPV